MVSAPSHSTQPPPDPDGGAGAPLGEGSIEVAPGVTLPGATLNFSAARSSGPGGQNVNKRATKVELRVFVDALPLDQHAKNRLRKLAGRRVTNEDELLIVSQTGRTQGANKRRCVQELGELIVRARTRPKIRKKTRPTRGSKERRLKAKQERSELKKQRQRTKRVDRDHSAG